MLRIIISTTNSGIIYPAKKETPAINKTIKYLLSKGCILNLINKNKYLIKLNKNFDKAEAIAAPTIPYLGIKIKLVSITNPTNNNI